MVWNTGRDWSSQVRQRILSLLLTLRFGYPAGWIIRLLYIRDLAWIWQAISKRPDIRPNRKLELYKQRPATSFTVKNAQCAVVHGCLLRRTKYEFMKIEKSIFSQKNKQNSGVSIQYPSFQLVGIPAVRIPGSPDTGTRQSGYPAKTEHPCYAFHYTYCYIGNHLAAPA